MTTAELPGGSARNELRNDYAVEPNGSVEPRIGLDGKKRKMKDDPGRGGADRCAWRLENRAR